jgi:hypothetical protein
MTLKLAMLALALLIGWFVLFRPRRKAPPASPRAAARPVTSLERCPRCGVFRLPDGDCACEPPTRAAG